MRFVQTSGTFGKCIRIRGRETGVGFRDEGLAQSGRSLATARVNKSQNRCTNRSGRASTVKCLKIKKSLNNQQRLPSSTLVFDTYLAC